MVVLAVLNEDLWFLPIISTVVCGAPILKEVIIDTMNKEVSAEALVVSALIACLVLKEYIAAAEIAIIMAVGELLEDIITTKARSGIDALGKVKVDNAHMIDGESTYNLPLEDIEVGGCIRVFPGETIPLDGIVVQGNSSINKSIMTGESVPVDVKPGDEVFSGTSNLYGSIDIQVTRCDSEGMMARMSRLLAEADASKSRIVNTADRWTKYILLGTAILTAVTYIVTQDVYRALTIMVVFCPCAFILATPTGIMAASGNMARNGVLLKNSSAIEGMNKVTTVLFDKTGTLTTGKIHSKGFVSTSSALPKGTVEGMVASLESRSEHPLGKAIATDHGHIGTVESFMNVAGQGIIGTVDGIRIAAGNADLMTTESPEGLDIAVSSSQDLPCTVVYVGMDGKCIGYFELEDTIKDDSCWTVKELRKEGVRTIMLTGDMQTVARNVAERIGLDDVVWKCKPETKMNTVENFERTECTCMLGDGMNDAPSLRRATVGISMGAIGNDVAVESSDIILMEDNISKLPGIYRLCKRTVKTIVLGLTLSMAINISGTVLAMLGMIGPIAGAILHNGGSLIVILLASSVLWADTWGPGKSVHDFDKGTIRD